MSYTEDIAVVGGVLKRELSHWCRRQNRILRRRLSTTSSGSALGQTLLASFSIDDDNDVASVPLDCEILLTVKCDLLTRGNTKVEGMLHVNVNDLIFKWGNAENPRMTWFSISLIGSIEKGQLTAKGSPLFLKFKDFRTISLLIAREKEREDLYQTLLHLSQPVNIEQVLAFNYELPKMFNRAEGWQNVDIQADYMRMGLPNEKWFENENVSNGEDYKICETYPASCLYVPRAAPTHVILGSTKFRSRNRFPVLSYYSQESGAALCRCSQPLTGFSSRCTEDEKLFEYILKTNSAVSPHLYLIDTRPKINAVVNKAQGKGFEAAENYSNMKFYFFAIENIHVMRSSQAKLHNVCSNASSIADYLSGIESCGWLKHIKAVLEAASFTANAIDQGISCVVHCSDGWDRTPQCTALTCLLLDPFYRTVHGFQILIEKEWLAFGHKFSDRCGHTAFAADHGSANADPSPNDKKSLKETSPIFSQFLECVYQLMCQFPQAFQFNERFLLFLHDEAHACRFGTFLGNCEKDRTDLKLTTRTYSAWGYMSLDMSRFLNPVYDPKSTYAQCVLRPELVPARLKIWTGLYNRYDDNMHPKEPPIERYEIMQEQAVSLRDHISWLKSKISGLHESVDRGMVTSPSSSLADSGLFTTSTIWSNLDNSNVVLNSPDSNPKFIDSSCSNQMTLSTCLAELTCSETTKSDSESGFEEMNGGGANASTTVAKPSNLSVSYSLNGISSSDLGGSSLEAASVSVKWSSPRNVKHCSSQNCSNQIMNFEKKNYCWRCGKVFCCECMNETSCLPALLTQKHVPVCKLCFDDLSCNNRAKN